MTGGYVAYDASGQPRGMGPTRESAIVEARHRGCESGRLRLATPERVKEAFHLIPPAAAPASQEAAPLAPPATGYSPTSAYFDAVCRGDFATAKRLLQASDEARRCRT